MLNGWYKSVLHVPGHLRLLGKTCLICGVGTDVAATVARVLAIEGCKILAADENPNDLRKLVSEIQDDGGFALSCEASPRSPDNLIRALSKGYFNRLDIIVDCWSWGQPGARISVMEEQAVPESFPFCPNSLQLLVARLVSTVSPKTLSAELQQSTFPFSGRIFSLAARCAGDVRLNAVCFGRGIFIPPDNRGVGIISPVSASNEPTENHISLALQIAYAALFLASDEARFVNGLSIDVRNQQSRAAFD